MCYVGTGLHFSITLQLKFELLQAHSLPLCLHFYEYLLQVLHILCNMLSALMHMRLFCVYEKAATHGILKKFKLITCTKTAKMVLLL